MQQQSNSSSWCLGEALNKGSPGLLYPQQSMCTVVWGLPSEFLAPAMSLSVPITWPFASITVQRVATCSQPLAPLGLLPPRAQSAATPQLHTELPALKAFVNGLRGSVLGFCHSQWFAWSLCYIFPLNSQDGTKNFVQMYLQQGFKKGVLVWNLNCWNGNMNLPQLCLLQAWQFLMAEIRNHDV